MEDRRRFTRFDLDVEAEIENQGQLYPSEILDIALKGVLLNCNSFSGQIGQTYEIKITLSPQVVMQFHSTLVHQESNNFGFKFVSQSLDSLSHLRSLLEFNSEDPDQIQKELFFLRQ